MPVVISVMVTIIFLSFYVYNRMAAEQDAYILAFRESIQKTKDAGISHLLSRVSSQTDRTYIGPDKPVFSAEDTGDSYAVSAKGKMNGRNNVASLVRGWELDFQREGFGMYEENGHIPGDLARPRKEELAAAISRCRGLVWGTSTSS